MIAWIVLVGCIFTLGWHYVVYPAVLWTVARRYGRDREDGDDRVNVEDDPDVTVVIIAHNEGDVIEERVENCLQSTYPTEKLEIIVASDASTDGTVERARAVSDRVRAFDNTPHNKSVTRNEAVHRASNDIVLFTDADTRYEPDCIRTLVGRLSNQSVGVVSGVLVSESFSDGAIGHGMGVYWKWEYALRRMQGQLGMLVKSTGANMGIRKEYFEPVADIVDIDQAACFDAIHGGGRSEFVPDAVATEQFPTNIGSEFATRRRLTIRGLTALWLNRWAFDVVARPFLALHTASYWLLRYLVPVLLVGTFLATAHLATSHPPLWTFLLLQGGFYGLAGCGFIAERRGIERSFLALPFSYCWANLGILVGLAAFLSGTRVQAYDADR